MITNMEFFRPVLQLMRPKHYLKNILIFLPLIFTDSFVGTDGIVNVLLGFIAFSLLASVVYIINDIQDRRVDARHPRKKYRPIASGKLSVKTAYAIATILLGLSFALQYVIGMDSIAPLLLIVYLVMNIAYSTGLKNYPIVDILILSLGFLIRVYYGGEIIGVTISNWLYLSILAGSFYMSLGKRRNEVAKHGYNTRLVNKFYSHKFLDKNMYVFFGLMIIYYSLWCIDMAELHPAIIFTVPILIVMSMMYSLIIEGEKTEADPVEVLTGSRALLATLVLFLVTLLIIVSI